MDQIRLIIRRIVLLLIVGAFVVCGLAYGDEPDPRARTRSPAPGSRGTHAVSSTESLWLDAETGMVFRNDGGGWSVAWPMSCTTDPPTGTCVNRATCLGDTSEVLYGCLGGSWAGIRGAEPSALYSETACSGDQGSCPLTTTLTVYTTVASGGDASLPDASAGSARFIYNLGNNTLSVWPDTGDAINRLSADASISLPRNMLLSCMGVSASEWACTFEPSTIGGSGVTTHGEIFWGSSDSLFDTGDEVCAANVPARSCSATQAVGVVGAEQTCAFDWPSRFVAYCY